MRVVLSHRGVVSGLILALAALPLPGRADEVSAPAVEIPVWNRSWVGTLGTKTVEVSLQRVADGLRGRYCYQPCSNQTRDVLRLSGRIAGEGAELGESDSSRANVATGTWRITSLEKGLTGTWISPNGKRSLPLALRLATAEDALEARFPFELRLVADAPPEEEGDGCPTPPMVSAIRLYKDGQLVQTLATESQGTCGMFTPSLIDANFDGWPDLTIAQFLPAGPNIPHQTWLYDPATGRYVDAPPMLQDISSAEFDPVHRIVYTYWRASCCEHGVSTYRWQDGDVQEVDSRSSYLLPLMDGDKRRLCYVIPSYGDGFIEYSSRVEQGDDGRLRLRGLDPASCDLDEGNFLERTYIEVWKPAPPGQPPTLLRTEETTWKPVQTAAGQRYCPEVPYYDNGRIRRVLNDNLDLCSEQNPLQP